jgi:hypothetical protein
MKLSQRIYRRYLLWQLRRAKNAFERLPANVPAETHARLSCRVGSLKHRLLRDFGDKSVFFAVLISVLPWERL